MNKLEGKVVQDDEIDLLELAKVIWSERRFILKVTGTFVLLGLIIAFTSKVEYKASCKLLPESNEAGPDLGGLGGLAGLAGFDLSGLGGAGHVLSPELFPEIVNSEPFLNKLINSEVYFEKLDTTISSFNYFKELDKPSLFGLLLDYTIGLPGKIKRAILDEKTPTIASNIGLTRYSEEDWEIIEAFSERLTVEVESSTGLITVEVEIPDQVAAAQVAQVMLEELTKYITSYKVEKAQINLEFIKKEFEKAANEYQEKQSEVARFTDRNRNLSNALVQTEYNRLQNEMDIAFEVYKGLATQLEQAKIQVNKETPVFTVLEPVRVPEDKSKPRRGLILVALSFLGGVISVLFVLIKNSLNV